MICLPPRLIKVDDHFSSSSIRSTIATIIVIVAVRVRMYRPRWRMRGKRKQRIKIRLNEPLIQWHLNAKVIYDYFVYKKSKKNKVQVLSRFYDCAH